MEDQLALDTELKACTRCKKEYPRTSEFFQVRKGTPYLNSWCKQCQRDIARERQAARRADPVEREKVLEEKRRHRFSEKGREWKRRVSQTDNHKRRQRHLVDAQ